MSGKEPTQLRGKLKELVNNYKKSQSIREQCLAVFDYARYIKTEERLKVVLADLEKDSAEIMEAMKNNDKNSIPIYKKVFEIIDRKRNRFNFRYLYKEKNTDFKSVFFYCSPIPGGISRSLVARMLLTLLSRVSQ